jgi:predicted exporter
MNPAALRLRFIGWLLLVLVIGVTFFSNTKDFLDTETDILALLPSEEHDQVVDAALKQFSGQAGRKVLFLVGAADASSARNAGADFAAALKANPGFASVQFELQNPLAQTLKAYAPYQQVLLSQQDRARLAAGDTQAIYRDAQRALYTPAGFARATSAGEDPLGLLSNFLLAQVPPLGAVQLNDGVLTVEGEGRHWVLVVAEIKDSAFATATQTQVMPDIQTASARARDAGAEVLGSGLLLHAAYATNKAHQEVSTFGLVSLLGTILLLLFVHRSMRPVMMSAASILIGLMAALIVSHWAFGRVHLLTLVFGSSLIGVAADYSTYFLTDAFRVPRRWQGRDALRQVAPGVLLGLATALTAYAVLMCTPFPALRQIALFSAVGLSVACGCVLCLFPLMRPPQAPNVSPIIERGLRALLPRPLNRIGGMILVLIVLLAVIGLPRLRVVNDLHLLQASPPELLKSEQRVRTLLHNPAESQFMLITGASEEDVLQREEALRPLLDHLQTEGAIASYAALTRALPSRGTQTQDADLMHSLDGPKGLLEKILTEMGYSAKTVAARMRDVRSARNARLTPDLWLNSPAAASYRHLWLGKISDRYATVVTLGGIHDLAALRALNGQVPGVRLVDKVGDISELLARFQRMTILIVVIGYLAVLLLFSLRYGWRSALRVVGSPALASAATLGLFGLIGEPLNLFSTFALLLVLGIGIDYAIFLREGRDSPLSSLIAVLVCAATALLSFGVLAFSGTPFIHSFGLTMLSGISLAVIIALLLGHPSDSTSLQDSFSP